LGISGSSSGNSKKKSSERESVQSKLDLATALSHLGQAHYQKAAYYFLRLGPARELGDWIGKVRVPTHIIIIWLLKGLDQVVAPGDIAIYGTLCALSSLPRSALKAQLLENSVFGLYIEQEPYVRELVEAYMGSNFKTVLELLSRYSVCVFLILLHIFTYRISRHGTKSTFTLRRMSSN
jgi:COP9 signalosome complex subunit 1